VDTNQPDPEAAAAFYGGLFGWELEDTMPPGSEGRYFMARLHGRDVAAIGSLPEGAPPVPAWSTYIWVENADETARRVEEAGGKVLAGPFEVFDAGRMAIFADPEGAVFSVWQPERMKGSQVVNEHGSVNFNGLHTRDVEAAKRFYEAVFGWGTMTVDGAELWTLPGYGDHLEERDPGLRSRIAEFGAEPGFEDVVASINPIDAGQADVPAHWSVTFAADDADELAARAEQLGGVVLLPPTDVPWSRMTMIADPQGASFIATQFVPENR
jgi:predicted enzyme related to lactoylglutathione lyase